MKTFPLAPARPHTRILNIHVMALRRAHISYPLLLAGILVWAAALCASAFAATAASGPAASAASIIGKNAQLNGMPMPAGATLFPGDVIRLGESSTAALQFGNSLVLAAAGTELVVESGGVTLRNGFLQVRAGGAQSFAIAGPIFHVSVAASGGMPSSAEVRLGGTRAEVSAVAGAADLTAGRNDAPLRLRAGESATLDAASGNAAAAQTAANLAAGQVSRLVPQVQIDRASEHIVAQASDRIYWNDELRSGPTGRAHITLKDGSQLNLGSDSSLRILQHDAQAQQTSLDLLLGRMRGKITKQSRQGAKFEVRTPMGVAGLVGTDFSLLVTDDYAELMVFEGAVRFTPLSGQAVSVTAGNLLRVSKAGVVAGPSSTTAQQAQNSQSLTDITGPASPTTVGAGSQPLTPLVITLSGVAAGVGIGVWQANRPTVSVAIP